METELLIRGENIQRIYGWYINNLFLVNRKYQRKLVWSLEEKASFIDSISQNFSVPLFLIAKTKISGIEKYEIIDGMQRLNAIFSFIEGEYPINFNNEYGYFDLSTMVESKELLDDGLIKQNTPILSRAVCAQIASYQLPLSVTSFTDEKKIEEIFRRINSNGRHLSNQELRQAGAVGKFPDLVRIIASDIRRDSSPTDILSLDRMKEISLSSVRLPYGIDLNSIFWVKQKIIQGYNMRISRDEELIAFILIYILLGKEVNPSSRTLNKIYRFDLNDDNDLADKVEQRISSFGIENIRNWINFVFSEVEKLTNYTSKDFRELLFGKEAKKMFRSFQVIYLAIYELTINEKKRIKDYNCLVKCLDGLGLRNLKNIDSKEWNSEFRDEKIKAIKAIIEPYFEISETFDASKENWVSKFENLLMHSRIEQQQHELKISLHHLDEDCNFNEELFNKILKTLTAMANNKSKQKGYLIVGIADNHTDKDRWKAIYSESVREYNNFQITGIQSECKLKYSNLDDYYNKIKQRINTTTLIEDYTKSYITRNMKIIQYYEKDVLIFEIESDNKPLFYDRKLYERQGSNVVEIDPLNYSDVFARFLQ